MDYADALHREGKFGDRSRSAWEEGYDELTNVFGKMRMECPVGEVILEADNDTVNSLAKEFDCEAEDIAKWVLKYQKVSNYNYWRSRSSIESEELMMLAHRDVYEGKQFYKKGQLNQARKMLYEGLAKFSSTVGLIAQRTPGLQLGDLDESLAEEILLSAIYFASTYDLTGEKVPDNYPMSSLATTRPDIFKKALTEFHFENRTKN